MSDDTGTSPEHRQEEEQATKALRATVSQDLGIDAREVKKLEKKLKKVEGIPERGIETLFRLISKHHFTVKEMVDRKSNILLSINAIIITILLGTFLPRLDEDPHFLVPLLLLLTGSFVSIVFAVVASRPGRSGRRSASQLEAGRESLLYFGSFQHETEEAFKSRMRGLMEDRTGLYDSLIDDVYFLGQELSRKHRHLRISFDVFTLGFGVAIAAFVISHLMFG